jgi:hypothetical protein
VNRFTPDTWWEALLRPFAMAAPDGNVYVEIMAPDLRYAMAILLAVLLVARWRRVWEPMRGAAVLGLLSVLAFVPWLGTTGNGRYFLPMLLLAGPLGIGLVYLQPWSRGTRALCAGMVLTLQAYVVFDARPADAWSLGEWRDAPYFSVEIPRELRESPATYVTLTSISYSLLYPQFDHRSSWINISGMSVDAGAPDTRRARELLGRSDRINLLVPSVFDRKSLDGLPSEELKAVLNRHLAPHHLALSPGGACQLLPSRSAAQMAFGDISKRSEETVKKVGFWVCPLRYPVMPPPSAAPGPGMDAVFDRLEQQCPGIFPPGTAATETLSDGAMRNYAGADMKVYVMNDGQVFYKYFRALNPERIASVSELMGPSFRMHCTNIRGRSGLPWQRSI